MLPALLAFRRFRSAALFLPPAFLALALFACAKPQQNPPLPDIKLGVVAFMQPRSTPDLLAGYMAEDIPVVPAKVLPQLDDTFAAVLTQKTKRAFSGTDAYHECKDAKTPDQRQGRIPALYHWAAVGACMNVDFLLVPQIFEFRERDGSEAGVVTPAKVIMDVFLVDVKGKSLISRSHFDETQTALSDNLLDAGKFISRGGKWITALALAREGMEKAVKDLGL